MSLVLIAACIAVSYPQRSTAESSPTVEPSAGSHQDEKGTVVARLKDYDPKINLLRALTILLAWAVPHSAKVEFVFRNLAVAKRNHFFSRGDADVLSLGGNSPARSSVRMSDYYSPEKDFRQMTLSGR